MAVRRRDLLLSYWDHGREEGRKEGRKEGGKEGVFELGG